MKLSYCCTIKVLNKTNDNINRRCNCRSKPNCPLNGECLTQYLVQKATSATSSYSFVYYGTSGGEFKSRYSNHTKSFRHRECMNETELSKHVQNLKTIVLITIYHGKSTKRPHHTNVAQNVTIFVCRKKFPSFVLIQTLY